MALPDNNPEDKAATKKAVKPLRPLTFSKAAAPEGKLNQIAWENAAKLKHRDHADDNAGLMFKAIRENYPTDEIRNLLALNIDRNARDENGLTFLHAAVAEKNLDALAVLINEGLDMHARAEGLTPLMLSFFGYRLDECAVMLAKADPDLSQHTLEGVTPVHLAAERYGCDRVLEVLLERGMGPAAKDDKGRPPLYYALKSKQETAFLLCTAGGCLPEDMPLLKEAIAGQEKNRGFDYDWNLLLDYAAKKDPKQLQAAIPKSGPQKPVEMDAAARAMFKDVRQHGSSFRFEKHFEPQELAIVDFDGMTPFMAGIEDQTGSDLWAVRNLVWETPPNVRDHAGRTALHYAVQHVSSPMGTAIDCLISHGADVDAQDKFGRTPLMSIMKGGDHLGRLMEAGADPFIRDNMGLTAMDYGRLYKSAYCTDELAAEMKQHGWYDEEDPQEDPAPRKQSRTKGFGY